MGYITEREAKQIGDAKASIALAEQGVHLRENPMDTFFVAMIQHEIVGVMALSRKQLTNTDVEKMRNHYRVDEVVNFERHRLRQQAIISHWVMLILLMHRF
jgi:hypothetical protein